MIFFTGLSCQLKYNKKKLNVIKKKGKCNFWKVDTLLLKVNKFKNTVINLVLNNYYFFEHLTKYLYHLRTLNLMMHPNLSRRTQPVMVRSLLNAKVWTFISTQMLTCLLFTKDIHVHISRHKIGFFFFKY